MEEKPEVGIGVLIFKEGKVLFGKRKSKHANGVYAPPGGKLDFGETFVDCAKREVREETGLEIENVKFLCLGSMKQYSPKHWVNIGMTADWKSGEPKVIEPEKSEEWKWYDTENLPQPLLAIIPNYLEALKTGKNFFDN